MREKHAWTLEFSLSDLCFNDLSQENFYKCLLSNSSMLVVENYDVFLLIYSPFPLNWLPVMIVTQNLGLIGNTIFVHLLYLIICTLLLSANGNLNAHFRSTVCLLICCVVILISRLFSLQQTKVSS